MQVKGGTKKVVVPRHTSRLLKVACSAARAPLSLSSIARRRSPVAAVRGEPTYMVQVGEVHIRQTQRPPAAPAVHDMQRATIRPYATPVAAAASPAWKINARAKVLGRRNAANVFLPSENRRQW